MHEPKINTMDNYLTRFVPTDGGRLFLNIETGRFLHKELPGLADYYFVTSTGGLLVLAKRTPPHAVRVVNPLATSCIKFKAPMPDSLLQATAYLRVAGAIPTLVLEHPSGDMAYSAQPDDEHFSEVNFNQLDKANIIWGIRDGTVDDLLGRIIAARS
jgi:hypothetical protein